MEIRRQYYETEALALDLEIQELVNKTTSFRENPIFENKNTELNNFIEKQSTNLIQKKDKKINRDMVAFQSGRTYRWSRTCPS